MRITVLDSDGLHEPEARVTAEQAAGMWWASKSNAGIALALLKSELLKLGSVIGLDVIRRPHGIENRVSAAVSCTKDDLTPAECGALSVCLLSAIELAGDINAKEIEGRIELLKGELRKLGPLIDLDATLRCRLTLSIFEDRCATSRRRGKEIHSSASERPTTVNTSLETIFTIRQMQPSRFNGENWEPFGDLMSDWAFVFF
jgi:hypothetical protein